VGTLALCGFPPFSGFWSKDIIVAAGFEEHPFAGTILAIAAFFTAFYMARLFAVAFLGSPRAFDAGHLHESPQVMTGPLILLAIPAAIAGFPAIANIFLTVPQHESSTGPTALVISLLALAAGLGLGFILYRGKAKDPISIPLFANRFYIDEFYRSLIKWTQDLLANVSAFLDRWVVDGGIVRGLAGMTWGLGFALRFLQIGNLQAYTFLFGFGVVLLLYLILFAK
jgi:NADH-quinone oxidoreductase subunit L